MLARLSLLSRLSEGPNVRQRQALASRSHLMTSNGADPGTAAHEVVAITGHGNRGPLHARFH